MDGEYGLGATAASVLLPGLTIEVGALFAAGQGA
jgi:hypothetical protein